jgi:hypothetical protein
VTKEQLENLQALWERFNFRRDDISRYALQKAMVKHAADLIAAAFLSQAIECLEVSEVKSARLSKAMADQILRRTRAETQLDGLKASG